MKVEYSQRGFEFLPETREDIRQSSAIGEYADSMDKPGSSFLWIGGEHFDREQVRDILDGGRFGEDVGKHLAAWLATGSLVVDASAPERAAPQIIVHERTECGTPTEIILPDLPKRRGFPASERAAMEDLLAYLGGRLAISVDRDSCVPTREEFDAGITRYMEHVRADERASLKAELAALRTTREKP